MGELARILVVGGLVVAAAGTVLLLADQLGLGRLPGDVRFDAGGVRVHLPFMTCLLVSVAATVLLNLLLRR
jgi:hypothetical protein